MKLPTWLRSRADRVSRSVSVMSAHDMLTWADAAGSEMRQGLTTYVRSGDLADLDSFERGLVVLVAMAEELRRRAAS